MRIDDILIKDYSYFKIVSFYIDLSYQADRSCPRLIYSYVYSERREPLACS